MNATACCDLHNQHCEPPGDLRGRLRLKILEVVGG